MKTSVNLYNTTSSEYTTEAVPFADFYDWNVDPVEAGTFTVNGTIGTITWNTSFTGIATISVRAINNCGDGLYSDGFEVTVDYIVGIPEPSEEDILSVYPNPNNGSFNIIAYMDMQHARINVYNIVGEKVYSQLSSLTSGETINIGLEGYPKGLYVLSIETDNFGYTEKLIIK